ncbi:MAG: hypothetical protein MUC99_08820 [Anaerolineae bacterium]|jgi:hypothetical protein|nr:hypothetical protein [Anaerolineae bacterium]
MTDDRATIARQLYVIISAAREMGATVEVYARLVELSGVLVEAGLTTEAANLLAWVMHQPDVPYDVYDRADDLWIDLESRLCPRVIADAKQDAPITTLRGVVEASFTALLPPES